MKKRVRITLAGWMIAITVSCVCVAVIVLVVREVRRQRLYEVHGGTIMDGRFIAGALDMYRLDTGSYPSTNVGLAALTNIVGENTLPYLQSDLIGRSTSSFHYATSADRLSYVLIWLGPDMTLGTEDDIVAGDWP
jgi:hypothetical protein